MSADTPREEVISGSAAGAGAVRLPPAVQRAIAAADAAEIVLALVEASPDRPLASIDPSALPPDLLAQVERLVEAYLRARALERVFVESDGEVARAIDEIALVSLPTIDRSLPDRIGNYAIAGTIAVGATSVVLLARQESPIEREVALKLIFEDGSDPRVATRVALERQILASLEHPNIARIYDFGYDGRNRPYLVMEHVRGGSIDGWVARRSPSAREIVRTLVLPVCAAIRAAHARGVLHCDIKCANVLVQEIDAIAHPKVIDFGIARAIAELPGRASEIVDLPAALGTLRWMSPEALAPGGGQLDVRTDVFGLGLLTFALVAGRPARLDHGAGAAETLRSILEDPVPRLAGTAPGIDRDLDAIVAKACALRPMDRYESVDAFVRDLEAWLAGSEVVARPLGVLERTQRRILRRWKIVLAAALLVLSVAAGFAIADGSSQARHDELESRAGKALSAAQSMRLAAGRSSERDAWINEALDTTAILLAIAPDSTSARALRDAALEEAILARLGRNERKAPETIRLVDVLLEMREGAARLDPGPENLERLSVALAYKSDTVQGTVDADAVDLRQLAIDEELHARFPDVRVYADNLCWTYQRIHDQIWNKGERERAFTLLHRSDQIAQSMLARHGRTPVTVYTAAAAAWYEAFALEAEGRIEQALDAAARARVLAMELLRFDPTHLRGATFLFRAAISEAALEIERGDPRRATEVLAEARAVAAPIVALERGAGFFGFPIAESWSIESEAWLMLGESDRAEFAADMLRQEIAREREGMVRAGSIVNMTTRELVLRIRIDLARGQSERARAQFETLLASLMREELKERKWGLEVLAIQFLEHKSIAASSEQTLIHIRQAAEELDTALRSIEVDMTRDQAIWTARWAIDMILERPERLAAAAEACRRAPAHSPRNELVLRRLERMQARIGADGAGAGARAQPLSPEGAR